MGELNIFRVQLETEIWSCLGFNWVVDVLVIDDKIFFYLGGPIGGVTEANLARFVGGVKTLALVKGVAVEVELVRDGAGRDVVVITQVPREETSPEESSCLDEIWPIE